MTTMKSFAYWSLSLDDAVANMDSSLQALSDEKATQRLAQVGPNLLVTKDKTKPYQIFLGQFKSPIVFILG